MPAARTSRKKYPRNRREKRLSLMVSPVTKPAVHRCPLSADSTRLLLRQQNRLELEVRHNTPIYFLRLIILHSGRVLNPIGPDGLFFLVYSFFTPAVISVSKKFY